ncbi:MAG: TrkA family potassium uptake protein [Kiritimatiellae bacterium]|nr:TrkA family potassium uptake protein [Kiritimatiellia bacterium]
MYIIIAGGGMVGGDLAKRLVAKKHDVVVVDEDKTTCDKLYSETGVIAVNGHAAHVEVLREAGIEKADVVVAATGDDAENLACVVLARSAGVDRVLVRMRDPAYESAYKLAGASAIVRVTDLMVNQMMMEVEQPAAREIMTIGGGRANIFMVIVPNGARVAGQTVEGIARDPQFPDQCVFIAVFNERTEELAIPRGNQVINAGDELFLVATAADITRAVSFLTAPAP